MKKLLFALPVILLLAAACNSSTSLQTTQQPETTQQQPAQTPPTTQNQNPSPTPTTPKTSNKDLSVTINNKIASGNVTAGSSDVIIGSYVINNPNSEDVAVSNVLIALPSQIRNTQLFANGALFSFTPDVYPGPGYSFSGKPFVVAAHKQLTFDVHANIESTASVEPGVKSLMTTGFNGCTGTGKTSGETFNCTKNVLGQLMKVVKSSTTSATITLDASTKAAVTQAILNGYNIIASGNASEIRSYILQGAHTDAEKANVNIFSDSQLLAYATAAMKTGSPSGLATNPAATWKTVDNTVEVSVQQTSDTKLNYKAELVNGSWYGVWWWQY